MSSGLSWARDGRDWPLAEHSRFVVASGLRWHVQTFGDGPIALLLHGTGASTHSWRDVAPVLGSEFTIVSPDLPGHAFTRGRPVRGLSLEGMAGAVAALLKVLGHQPAVVAAHSAGAAIAVRMALDGAIACPIVGFGPALLPFQGAAGPFFSGMARLLFVNPVAPRLFAGIARRPGQVERFLERSTGSRIDRRGVILYARLFGAPDHCAGALEMMARWNLDALAAALPRLPVQLTVAHGARDATIRPADGERAANAANGSFTVLPGLGHLAHEERPEVAAQLIRTAADRQGEG